MDHVFNTTTLPGQVALRRGLVPFLMTAFLMPAAVVAEPLFVSTDVALSQGPGGNAPTLARISVAAEVDRLETRDGFHRVAVEGWAREGVERVLFGLPGKRILAVQVPKANVGALQQIGRTEDAETGITWNRMRLEGWIPQDVTQTTRDPIWEAAWGLFSERCTACHQRRVPEHYTANQWRSLVKVMGPRTGLPKSDQGLILTFLQYHASDTIE